MNPNERALDILQKARDALCARLTERIIESEEEIVDDAEGGSYVSEIEAIYEQIGGRLSHLNAMLANLPPAVAQPNGEAAASEVVYADLAASPSATFDVDFSGPPALLGLPAPASCDESPAFSFAVAVAGIVRLTRTGDIQAASRAISEAFDLRPSLARRGACSFAQQLQRFPELGRRLEQLGTQIHEINEYAVATLLGECFEFQAIDALLIARSLQQAKISDNKTY